MSLRTRNKASAMFNMSSLTDIIFLLLIFFLLTSTLVQPNAVKLLLPNSNSKTQARQTVAVAINADLQYHVNNKRVSASQLPSTLRRAVENEQEASVVLYADKSVPVDHVVRVMNVARDLKVQMVLATEPPR